MIDDMQRIWHEMEQAHNSFTASLVQFFGGEKGRRLELVKEGFNTNRYLAITILQRAPVDEVKELLPFLLSHARSVHGYLGHVREIILRIPKEWLLEHIEAASAPFLETGTDDDYRRFLELYIRIDAKLTERLALRAASSSDSDIREAGEDFMEKLGQRPKNLS